MPRRADDGTHFRYNEKVKAGLGSIKQRLGSDSQLPFGYCCLSLQPVRDAVITPSGHMYEKEVILEYLLNKTREIKLQTKLYEEEQARLALEEEQKQKEQQEREINRFIENVEGIEKIVKRKASSIEDENSYMASRKRIIDDTDQETKMNELRAINPWLPQFTPQAEQTNLKKPPKRPTSPMTSRPLRVSDLIPINMHREVSNDNGESNSTTTAAAISTESTSIKFICPVSRKTITSQPVIAIKTTNEIMLESVAKDLAYPTMTCPITGKRFQQQDIIPLVRAVSYFSTTGDVEAKKYRPSIN